MPSLGAEDFRRIDRALQSWRQGDVAFDDSAKDYVESDRLDLDQLSSHE